MIKHEKRCLNINNEINYHKMEMSAPRVEPRQTLVPLGVWV